VQLDGVVKFILVVAAVLVVVLIFAVFGSKKSGRR
jgi:hypothetical protein